MTTILSFLLVLLVVVAVHEMGHYLAARAVGVRVLRFSVGFGRPFLRRFDRRGTEWALAPIPLGGYVHLFDEAARKRGAVGGAHETIDSKSAPLRMVVLAAGPAANFVLAFLIYALLGVLGIVSIKPLIGAVAPQSPAAAAGVLPGDEIARVNGRETPHWHGAFAALVDAAAARAPTEFDLRREGRTVAAAVAADAIDLRAAANDPLRALGIAPESFATAEIAFVVADGAAERAGIQTGDEIVSIDGEVVDSWPQVVRLIEGAPRTEIEIVVWRDGEARAFAATPRRRRARRARNRRARRRADARYGGAGGGAGDGAAGADRIRACRRAANRARDFALVSLFVSLCRRAVGGGKYLRPHRHRATKRRFGARRFGAVFGIYRVVVGGVGRR